MVVGAVVLMALVVILAALPASRVLQFATIVLGAWLLLLGSVLTVVSGVRGRSRTVALCLLAFTCVYIVGRTVLG